MFLWGALKTFIDNVTIQVGERHLVDSLDQVFHSPDIIRWDDDKIASVVAEPKRLIEEREDAEKRKVLLEEALRNVDK